jgi:MoaA/NifB/PqqE/SkfB family radical SAM enzyme
VKALIKVGYACNDHCTFCHTEDVRHIDDTSDGVFAKIERAKALGHSMVVFSGGEPTIRKETHAWATRVAELGMDLGFVTNGRRFAYPDFVEDMLSRRLGYVYLSLHGGTARVHNSLVRADAYEETFSGVKNLHGKIPVLSVNCVVTRTNVMHLRGFIDRLLPFPELTVKLSMAAPKGGGENRFEHVVPDVGEAAKHIADALAYGVSKRDKASGPKFAHDGVPLCLLPGFEDLYDDLRTNDFRTMSEVGEPDFFPVDDVIKVQPDEPCARCALRGPCPGLFRGTLERQPNAVSLLRAQESGARSNSYTYVPTRDLMRPKGAPCPVKTDGPTSYDRGRSLFLRLADRMRLFETRTRDFADVEILHTKDDVGQVYVDVSKKLAPDDFARDLKKLRPSDECEACEERPRCTGAYVPVSDDVFTRDDARVHELLGALDGDVVDIGAGEGTYLQTIAERAKSGSIRYTAIEPDEGRASGLKMRHPWASVRTESAEAMNLPDDSVDHALVLRSYNHLPSPERVLDRVTRALRVGGSLTIVDNIAFGLLRQREHAANAERGPGIFEHHRNDDAERAHAVAQKFPLKLVERRDVSHATSNQWLLRYVRTEEIGTR